MRVFDPRLYLTLPDACPDYGGPMAATHLDLQYQVKIPRRPKVGGNTSASATQPNLIGWSESRESRSQEEVRPRPARRSLPAVASGRRAGKHR